jgi:hypothetical protein
MNRRKWLSVALGGIFLWSAEGTRAQEAPALPPRGEMLRGGGPGKDFTPPPMGDRVELLGFEGMRGGKVVTGAPFSAVVVSESTQTLADGNHITWKTQTNLYRDSQGRLRKEVTLPGFGPLAASGEPKSFVVLNDPVAQTNFVLHADTKVAEKMDHPFRGEKGAAKGANGGKWQARQQQEIASGNLKTEDLGTQTIAGVSAQGTRLTRTIPAGQIGNEKPILIVHETWLSNDLQMVVMSKRSNPWIGETTYTLTNIQRKEPNAALFAVPSDYTVKAGQPFGKHGGHGYQHGTPPAPPADN